MSFMILIKADEDTEAGVLPSEQLLTEMGAYNEQLVNAGVMVVGEGLHPSSRGVRVRFAGERTAVIDGPFAETKELLAGFWLWNVASKEEAIEWLKRCPNPTGADAVVELREAGCPSGLEGVGPQAPSASPAGARRYMVLIKSDRDMEAGVNPGNERLAAMARRNAEAVQEGTLLLAQGLQPSSKGSRVRFSGHARTVLDGPFAETKELIAGFWLIQAASMAEAIAWVERYPYPRDRDAEYEIEIRPVFGAEDFGEVLTPELRAQEERLRARATELNLAATRS
jgi:hypothetical protein